MSRRLLEILGVLVLLLSLIIVTALQAAPPAQNDDPNTATMTVLAGSVQVLAPEAETWEYVTDTVELTVGSRVRTDAQSIAIIQWFTDNTRLEMFPNSEIFINEFEVTSNTQFSIEVTQFLGRTAHCIENQLQPNMSYVVHTSSTKLSANESQVGVAIAEDYETMLGLSSGSVLVEHQQSESQVILVANAGLIVPLQSTNLPLTVELATLPADFVTTICNATTVSPFATPEPADGGASPVITAEPADGGGSGGPVQTPEPVDDNGDDDDDDDDDDDSGGGNSGPGGGGGNDDGDDDDD